MRADQLLVDRGLAASRSQAQRLIAAGVRWRLPGGDWKAVAKNGEELRETAELQLLDTAESRFVSRGGLKLDGALAHCGIDVTGLRCLDVALPNGATCADLAARDVILAPDFVDGSTCASISDDPEALDALGDDGPAVAAICRYGQALGRELGEPDDHYEETNAVGWGFVDDLWAAAMQLYGRS